MRCLQGSSTRQGLLLPGTMTSSMMLDDNNNNDNNNTNKGLLLPATMTSSMMQVMIKMMGVIKMTQTKGGVTTTTTRPPTIKSTAKSN